MSRKKISDNQKLARALDAMHQAIGSDQGVIKGSMLKQVNRETLQKSGFLREIIKGWYFVSNPTADASDSTPFFAHYFEFLEKYLSGRFDDRYCLSAEHSMLMHAQINVIPKQIIIIIQDNITDKVRLYEDYSLFIYANKNIISPELKVKVSGIQCYTPAASLVSLTPKHYQSNSNDIQIVMSKIENAVSIARLVSLNAQGVARLIGAYRQLGQHLFADNILKQIENSGLHINEISNPFDKQITIISNSTKNSPLYSRIKLLWQLFRDDILAFKPNITPLTLSESEYIASIESIKIDDAYHSLSIELYRVTPELIQKIANGEWNPQSEEDKRHRDAMAAKGYLEAFNLVKSCVIQAYLKQKSAADLFIEEHQKWFAQLFMPSVDAGLLRREDLIGYRRNLVFLSGSKHVPPHFHHILDGLDGLKECLLIEQDSFVKAVMCHFLVGFIHPFMDGNGRTARFSMNVMLAEGGYPWTIIPVDLRNQYMLALEKASVDQDIKYFAKFISDQVVIYHQRLQTNKPLSI